MSAQTFHIPIPPSVNGLFANARKGRRKTAKYKSWREEAGWEIRRQRVQAVAGPVAIELRMRRPTANSDVDNRLKAPLDLLVHLGLIRDDSDAHKVSAEWDNSVEDCVVTVRPRA